MTKQTHNLVEKTHGPHRGKIWRSEEMTEHEAAKRNAMIEVMEWEPAANIAIVNNTGADLSECGVNPEIWAGIIKTQKLPAELADLMKLTVLKKYNPDVSDRLIIDWDETSWRKSNKK